MPSPDLQQLAHRIHMDVETLLRAAVPPSGPEGVQQAVEAHLVRCLDVQAGVRLVRQLEELGQPVPDDVVEAWANFLSGKEGIWSSLFESARIDDFESNLDDEGPLAIAHLDWPLVRVLVATRVGDSVMETGRRWREGLPDPEQLGGRGFAEAMRLLERHIDAVLETLHTGLVFREEAGLLGLEHIVRDWLPSFKPDVLSRWGWLVARVKCAENTGGLHGADDAVEAFEAAFSELPVPDSLPGRAAILEILCFDLPEPLLQGGLSDLRYDLAGEFGVEDDIDDLDPKALRRKIGRALKAKPRAKEDES